ncbi:unnamed protein product [Caenorhabditis angaria]|uniref:Endonuclease n=1 Tax=Caenorhabditis angaria TaxID=860376 RepID=A0A9P1MWK4_9PELO|nr:unnamed protein product [Caenorhabditis angaria]
MWKTIVSTSAVAGISFLVGKYSNEQVIRNAQSAENVELKTIGKPQAPIKLDENAMGPSRASEIMKFGFPGFDHIRSYEDFVLSYDRRTRNAHWTLEHLVPERLVRAKDVDRAKSEFRPDTSMHSFFRAENEDFRGSGFDRGHLVAAANHRKNQLALDQTFFLTNISPQVGKGFNRDKWNDLEIYTRKVARKALNTYVVTGPLFLPKTFEDGKNYVKYQVIGKNNVAVPTHYFKVLLLETSPNNYELECFILPNAVIPDSTELSTFHVPLEAIEKAAGLLIFEKLPKGLIKKINGKSTSKFW